jgi:hypothetical protein
MASTTSLISNKSKLKKVFKEERDVEGYPQANNEKYSQMRIP